MCDNVLTRYNVCYNIVTSCTVYARCTAALPCCILLKGFHQLGIDHPLLMIAFASGAEFTSPLRGGQHVTLVLSVAHVGVW